jgi:hypothetical protein
MSIESAVSSIILDTLLPQIMVGLGQRGVQITIEELYGMLDTRISSPGAKIRAPIAPKIPRAPSKAKAKTEGESGDGCKGTYSSGANKGKTCGRQCVEGSEYCKIHDPNKVKGAKKPSEKGPHIKAGLPKFEGPPANNEPHFNLNAWSSGLQIIQGSDDLDGIIVKFDGTTYTAVGIASDVNDPSKPMKDLNLTPEQKVALQQLGINFTHTVAKSIGKVGPKVPSVPTEESEEY